MFRILALTAMALILAIGGGTASVWFALDSDEGFGVERIGPWTTHLASGGSADNPYARARRARNAELPLGIAEGMSFHARTDDEGRELSGNCTYLLEGNVPVARLWTLHARNTGTNPPREASRMAGLHSRQILRRADSSFTISVGSAPMPGNWIAVPAQRPFALVLTLFDTPVTSTLRVSEQGYPAIRRVDCA